MEAMETKNTGGVSTIKRTSTTQLYASPYSTLLMTPSLELPAAITALQMMLATCTVDH